MVAYYTTTATDLENDTETKILQAAQRLFARQGYGGTTTRDLAQAAGVAEGTLFRHFESKKAILIKVAADGWTELLTDLLTELSEMANYKAIDQVMLHRIKDIPHNADLMRVCFMESQLHPELQGEVQSEILAKMVDVTEAFFSNRHRSRHLSPAKSASAGANLFGHVCDRGVQPFGNRRTRHIPRSNADLCPRLGRRFFSMAYCESAILTLIRPSVRKPDVSFTLQFGQS